MPKKVLIAVPPAMLEHIDFIAQCEHRTRSDLIREALRRYVDNFRRNQAPAMSLNKVAMPTEDEPAKPFSRPFGEYSAFAPTQPTPQHTGAFQITENKDNSLSIERDRAYNLPSAR